jgi:hypothetical protein
MSKFKITPRDPQAPQPQLPASIAEFAQGADLVRSQASAQEKQVRLNLDIGAGLHRRLKQAALDGNTNVAAIVRDLLNKKFS